MTKQEKISFVENNFKFVSKSNTPWTKQEIINAIKQDLDLDLSIIFEIKPFPYGFHHTEIDVMCIRYNIPLEIHEMHFFHRRSEIFYILDLKKPILDKYYILQREKKLNILLND